MSTIDFTNRIPNLTPTEDVKHISKFRKAVPQFIAVGVKNILLFGYGMTLGFPTIVIPAIMGGDGRDVTVHHEIVLNREEISWFSSINLLCVPLGCIFSGPYTNPIGKRLAMQIVNVPILMAWLFFYFSSNIYHLYAGLCLAGFSGGLMEAPVLTYVSEVTQPKYRGMLAATGSACLILGVFTQFLLGTFMKWRTIAALSTIFPVISITALVFIPESPHWLILKDRLAEARTALAWLRGWVPLSHIEDEFNEMYDVLVVRPSEVVRLNKRSPIVETMAKYTRRSFLKPYALISGCFFIGHFSGKTPLQTYAVQIFHTLKAPIDKYYATSLLGAAEFIGTIICVILVRHTGKRPIVFVSTIGCGLCFLGTATYARFLDIVPGITIENVVANVSSLDLNKETLYTQNNITQLVLENIEAKNEELRLLKQLEVTTYQMGNEETTTAYPDLNTEPSTSTKKIVFLNLFPNTAYRIRRDIQFELNETIECGNDNDGNCTEVSTEDFSPPSDDYISLFDNTFVMTDLALNLSYDEPFEQTTLKDLEVRIDEIEPELDAIPDKIVIPVAKAEENRFLWLPLTLLIASALFAHAGIRLIPWMLIGEIFPASIRSGASGISGGTGYLFGFLANKLFLRMLASMTLPGTFWFYSSVSLIGALVLYFVLPETEGKSLIEIEQSYTGRKANVTLSNNNIPIIEMTTQQCQRFDYVTSPPTYEAAIHVPPYRSNDSNRTPTDIRQYSDQVQAQGSSRDNEEPGVLPHQTTFGIKRYRHMKKGIPRNINGNDSGVRNEAYETDNTRV